MADFVAENGEALSSGGTTLEMAREKLSGAWNLDGGASATPSVRTVEEGATIVVGSGKGADVRVFDQAVSARHCALTVQGGELLIRDLGSKNGTFVGGASVETARLSPGS